MRTLLSSLIAAGLLAAPVAQAQCVQPAEQTALDVSWLKSQAMVTALTCNQQDKYNAFVVRYRADLVNADKQLAGYFQRAHGRRGTAQRDDYITQLANSQSQTGIKQGTSFCDRSASLLDEVMALRTSQELSDYAAAKGLAQPISVSACGAAAPRAASSSSTRRTSTSSRHRS